MPHPENQIRSSIIGFTENKDTVMGESGSDATRVCMAFSCKWQASMRVAGTYIPMYTAYVTYV